ncbi:hypothetical protein TNCV_2801 [Trichonephila clavipes]|nr:hypothetical protein TNCV_2801 [Trichonephila clavipes]
MLLISKAEFTQRLSASSVERLANQRLHLGRDEVSDLLDTRRLYALSPVMASDQFSSSSSSEEPTLDLRLLLEINRLCEDAIMKGDDTPFLLLNVDDVIEKIKQWKLAMPRVTPYYGGSCGWETF